MDATETAMEETTAPPLDYRLVCRTCLASDAEYYKLDSHFFDSNNDEDNPDMKSLTFLECLHYCTRLADRDRIECEKLKFPIYICTECSSALQVSYNFIRNALEAHEILRQKLGSECGAATATLDEEQRGEWLKKGAVKTDEAGGGNDYAVDGGAEALEDVKMRFRCKICNEKVETKKALKEHVKFHLDIISYCCQLCTFECKKRSLLSDHYMLVHKTQPTRDQLKPHTKTMINNDERSSTSLLVPKLEETDFEDPVLREMDKIHNPPAAHVENYTQSTRNEIELQKQQQKLQQQNQKELEMQFLLTPSSGNASAAISYMEAAAEATSAETIIEETTNSISTGELQQYGAEQFNVTANELTVGNEFVVMADGTVEEVMGNGVVIEYINTVDDGVKLDDGLLVDNIMQLADAADIDNQTISSMDMDVDDIIIEESLEAELAATSNIVTSTAMPPSATMPRSTAMSRSTAMPIQAETIVHTLQNIEDELPPPSIITATNVITPKRIKCKICTSNFLSQEKLKTHMLTHNEIPHFFCDQCSFYTFFKIDLTQHYKTKHKLQPTQKQLQPKNKVKSYEQPADIKHVYACDLCLYETRIKSQLRRHYLAQHQEEATEVQLRPTIDESATLTQIDTPMMNMTMNFNRPDSPPKNRGKLLRPDYPKGLSCRKCLKIFYWRDKLKEHYKQHVLSNEQHSKNDNATFTTPSLPMDTSNNNTNNIASGSSLLKINAIQYHTQTNRGNSSSSSNNNNNSSSIQYDATSNVGAMISIHANEMEHVSYNSVNTEPSAMDAQAIVEAVAAEAQAQAQAQAAAMQQQQQQLNVVAQMNAPAPDIIMDIPVAATISTTTMPMHTTANAAAIVGDAGVHITMQQPAAVAVVAGSGGGVGGGGGYVCQQIPSDAIPQVVETDTTIDNSELDFVFNEGLFEDFEEEEENEDEENEEDADGAYFKDLLLTSDDDFDDILQDQHEQAQQQRVVCSGSGGVAQGLNVNSYQPYCVHCNKKFLSQYQFENHMFVHRGLAPYRCEMCTNLYNTKRALIRHYRAVHKRIPTRDMIQAKGDKVAVDHTPLEHLNIVEQKAVTLMCAKCPFESAELHVMQIHLTTVHGLVDENYILQKLPFECPRCIRSYASRARLMRHLDRSHSVATIMQSQQQEQRDTTINNNALVRSELVQVHPLQQEIQQQLQQQHQQQQQQGHHQQQQYQPYVEMKGTVSATTTIGLISTAPIAVTAASSSLLTTTSSGQATIIHANLYNNNNDADACDNNDVPFNNNDALFDNNNINNNNYDANDNNNIDNQFEENTDADAVVDVDTDVDEDDDVDADTDDDDDADADDDGVDVGGYVDIEESNCIGNNNNNYSNNNISSSDNNAYSNYIYGTADAADNEVSAAAHQANRQATPLNQLIANMEDEENKFQIPIPSLMLISAPISANVKPPISIQVPAPQKIANAANSDGRSLCSRPPPINEHNELFDEYACGICSQSWRTAAELHGHECMAAVDEHNHNVSQAQLKIEDANAAAGLSNADHADENSTSSGNSNTTVIAAVSGRASHVIGRKTKTTPLNLMSERSLYLFKCDICHCNYKTSALLKHHMKRHMARKYRCSDCPKTYINLTELRCHRFAHTGERPYKCDLCPKQFTYSHHLKRHREVAHFGHRYCCTVEGCGRSFTTQSQLKIHGWKHNGNEPYKCKFCRRAFRNREGLRNHSRKIHQVLITEKEIAEIYRENVGHTNPHDFTVSLSDGKMLRRCDLEQAALPQGSKPTRTNTSKGVKIESKNNATTTEEIEAAETVTAVVAVAAPVEESKCDLSPLLTFSGSTHHPDDGDDDDVDRRDELVMEMEIGVKSEVEEQEYQAIADGCHGSGGGGVGATTHVPRRRHSSTMLGVEEEEATHGQTKHTYILPAMEEQGRLPHLENAGTY